MTMEQFINKVSNAVRAYFGGGLDITVQKVMKNNGVEMTGLIFMEKGSDIAATIYLDSYYEAYGEGTPLGEIVRKLIRTYEEHRPAEKLNLDFFRDYGKVRTRLAAAQPGKEQRAAFAGSPSDMAGSGRGALLRPDGG